MPTFRALDHPLPAEHPPASGAAVRAVVLALAGTALAAGLRHATTGSAASWPALLVAAAVLTACAHPAIRPEASRASTLALTAAQALLPGWLEPAGTDTPAARLDGHLRLPPAWHHQPVAMAALNLLVGLALILLLRGTADLPARLAHAAAGTARCCWTRLPYVIGLVRRRTAEPLPAPVRTPRPAVALPRPHALMVLLHRAQPCAP
ncbi:hypothetical protein [Streptomyces sp. NPDC004284]|uniref:hypothetical protein n=1 Tax=Streptomyces sp. NPDC004284 TaxID=3364695 RepID=UPI0036A8ABC3